MKELELIQATKNNEIDTVKRLLRYEENIITATDKLGKNLLHHAKSAEMLTLLLSYPALLGEIDHRDNNGDTPLAVFASIGRIDLVRVLLTKGADPNVKNNQGQTAREVVNNRLKMTDNDPIKSDYQAIIELLDSYNRELARAQAIEEEEITNNREIALIQAIKEENITKVKSLLKENVNIFKAVTFRTRGGFASETAVAIEIAAESKNKNILTLLIQQNSEINIPKAIKHQVFGHMSLLMWVAAHGVIENVDLLLKKNADINAKDTVGFTALMHAVKRDHCDIALLLLKNNKIDMTATDKLGRNVLHHANSTVMLTLLLNCSAVRRIINNRNNDGDTPLAVFASIGSIDLVKVLLQHGADPNVENCEGKTARDVVDDRLKGIIGNDSNNRDIETIKIYQAIINLLDFYTGSTNSTSSLILAAFLSPEITGDVRSEQDLDLNHSNQTLNSNGCMIL